MMARERPSLLFVSPRFLFPVDSGGKIRTTQILRGMKAGKFNITLALPKQTKRPDRYNEELSSIADQCVFWPEAHRGLMYRTLRLRHLFSQLPLPVAVDKSRSGSDLVAKELLKQPDLVVFDFPHSVVLAPHSMKSPSVLFTHNVEAEIFLRHFKIAGNPIKKWLWRNQYMKMQRFERDTLMRFDRVIAVSERDKEALEVAYGTRNISVIPTGVDLDYFNFSHSRNGNNFVFTGSMDWLANIDGVEFLMEEVWPLVLKEIPDASMTVVGRSPPRLLIEKARARNLDWEFTGYVNDVRPYVNAASVYIIPLRVGGGTRLKVFEAMAMGCPVISTSIGVEGLPVKDGEHYLRADSPIELAAAIKKLIREKGLSGRLSRQARDYVQRNFSYEAAALKFEQICYRTCNHNLPGG